MSAVAVIVCKMFGSGNYTALFECFNVCDTHSGGKKNIFTITLFGTSPARIAGDVDYRRQHLANTNGTQLFGNCLPNPKIKFIVEGSGHPNALRETRSIAPLSAVQRLAMLKHGNSPPAGFYRFPGIGIYGFGTSAGR